MHLDPVRVKGTIRRWTSQLTLRETLKEALMRKSKIFMVVAVGSFMAGRPAFCLEPFHLALASRSFQYTIFPLAQERGYMKEEGIDLRIVQMQTTPGIQALITDNVQFSGSAVAPLWRLPGRRALKTILAVNDKVHQWLYVRPNMAGVRDLKGKKIATTGLAAAATFMLKQVLPKYGLDGNKDVTFITAPTGNRLTILVSGVVEGSILSTEDRYPALEQGMKEVLYFGNEVKNSWGTVATSDRFIKEKPKLMAGFMRAMLKAVRFLRKDRETTINTAAKFTGMQKPLAARMYDDLLNAFTANGTVDEETQRNDLAIVAQVAGVSDPIAPARAYDFSFALEADQQLSKQGWKP
jgi:ABC-type nitrate/sulfonate/bicarbonate transport system substrate-binding protein